VAKVYKPNFIYIKSDLLKQEVAVNKKTGKVFCEDGVEYSPQEMAIIEKAGGVLDMPTHRVKKIIGGVIVDVERSGIKTVESGQRASAVKNNDTSEKIQGSNETRAQNRDGELDIF